MTATRTAHFTRNVEYVIDGRVEVVGALFYDDTDDGPATILRLDAPTWRALGSPRSLTVTVEPGAGEAS